MAKTGVHVPSDESREAVSTLTAAGWPQTDIMKLLGIGSKHTLTRHYRHELNEGALAVHSALAQGAIRMALGGDRTMLIFVLKTKFGWRERERASDDGTPGAAAIGQDTDPEVTDRGQSP